MSKDKIENMEIDVEALAKEFGVSIMDVKISNKKVLPNELYQEIYAKSMAYMKSIGAQNPIQAQAAIIGVQKISVDIMTHYLNMGVPAEILLIAFSGMVANLRRLMKEQEMKINEDAEKALQNYIDAFNVEVDYEDEKK